MADLNSPVKLCGSIFTPIWSGNRLSRVYCRFNGYGMIGESWETSTETGNEATVSIDGQEIPFSKYLNLVKTTTPPLVKLIDAAKPLSIQVHPDDITAVRYNGVAKSEIWYVLDADPGATILYGTVSGVTAEDTINAIHTGEVESLLNRITVKPGDVYMIPSGMIHSLGAGITVLEVQNCAGTTYRVKDISGCRETHSDESAASLRVYSLSEAAALAFTDSHRLARCPLPGEVLASTKDYALTHYASGNASKSLILTRGGVYMFCERGYGVSGSTAFSAGDSLYFGEDGCTVELESDSSVLFVV